MPRILLVSISGAALAVSGVVYQTIFRNPLASGDVIGASSGCSLGAVFAILFYQESWLSQPVCLSYRYAAGYSDLSACLPRQREQNPESGGCRIDSAGGCDLSHDDDEAVCRSCNAAGKYGILADGRVLRCLVVCRPSYPCAVHTWNEWLVSAALADTAAFIWRRGLHPWRQCEAHTMGIPASGYPSDFQCDQCCGNRQLGFSADTPYYPYRLSQADFTD